VTRARQALGRDGEEVVARHLEALGWRIVDRNFRAAGYEIDLVAERDGVLAFVEVKTRKPGGFAPPATAVDWRKRRRIAVAAQAAALRWGRAARVFRFDVAAVIWDDSGPVVEHLEDAFRLGE
jgi:putative endonuclease